MNKKSNFIENKNTENIVSKLLGTSSSIPVQKDSLLLISYYEQIIADRDKIIEKQRGDSKLSI